MNVITKFADLIRNLQEPVSNRVGDPGLKSDLFYDIKLFSVKNFYILSYNNLSDIFNIITLEMGQ